MQTVDWMRVFFHFLWIFGASVILTVLGYIWYTRARLDKSLLGGGGVNTAVSAGLFMAAAGLGFLVHKWWLAGIFWLASGLFLAHIIRDGVLRLKRRNENKK